MLPRLLADNDLAARVSQRPDCHFHFDEVAMLWVRFHQAGMVHSTVGRGLFAKVAGDTFFPNRVFTIIADELGTPRIPFDDLLSRLSFCSPNASLQAKREMCFKAFALTSTRGISREDLAECLRRVMCDNGFCFSQSQLMQSVDKTFRQIDVNGDGLIDQSEFDLVFTRSPQLVLGLIGQTWDVLTAGWIANFSLFRAMCGTGESAVVLKSILGPGEERDDGRESAVQAGAPATPSPPSSPAGPSAAPGTRQRVFSNAGSEAEGGLFASRGSTSFLQMLFA